MNDFKRWYEKNREKLAEKRKRKYQEDPEYREKRRQEAKRYYWLKRRPAVSVETSNVNFDRLNYEPDDAITIEVTNDEDIRKGLALTVPVYRPAKVAKALDRTVQTLRLWSLKGLIPENTYRAPGGARLFTEDQFKVLAKNKHLLNLPSNKFEENPFFLEVQKQWKELEPDGIEVMSKDKWRLIDSACPWCGSRLSLQHYEGGDWEHVLCFECADPVKVDERVGNKEVTVKGECPFCNYYNEETQEVINKDRVILFCKKCSTRVNDPEVSV